MSVSKAVLITGCSSGIGWATAEWLASVGWRVYATARNIEKIAPLGDPISITVAGYTLSLRLNEAEMILVEDNFEEAHQS